MLFRSRMLFDVFSHSFFNPEDKMSAGELLMMFHFYFLGNPEGLIFDVLLEPFSDSLWRPFARYLTGLGVQLRLNTAAEKIEKREAGWRISAKNVEPVDADGVVLAVTVPALQAIVRDSPDLADETWRAAVAGLSLTLPFAVWRIWLDKPVNPDRSPFVGTAGLGMIDNISVYELFEGESRRWALRHGGSVIEIHAYAVPEGTNEEEIKRFFLDRLHLLYPETKEKKICAERFLWRQDCPAFAPGGFASRPTVATPLPGVALAGDFVQAPIPSALMEKAVTTGILAANRLLADWNVRSEDLYSVPLRGLFKAKPALRA